MIWQGTRRSRLGRVSLALAAVAATATVTTITITASADETNGRLDVLPAVQEWNPGSGSYTFGTNTRIVLDSEYAAALSDTATTFGGDLRILKGTRPSVVTGDAPDAGDIYLTLGSTDGQLGDEGYGLETTNAVRVTARTADGAFYATRTLLQLLRRGNTIPVGTVRDWPRQAERGLSLDAGRKFFTTSWIASHLRELSYLKMNVFHWHLSDIHGFRLESSTYPEVTSPAHYSKQDVQNLVALAARYHVTIIPEIDMPGHMDALLAKHTDLRLTSAAGTYPGKIDISKAAARTFATKLVSEYLDLFPGPVWHMGADEYLPAAEYASYPQIKQYAVSRFGSGASAQDAVIGFINDINAVVRAKGKTLEIWNDGLDGGVKTKVSTNVRIEYWNGGSGHLTPPQLTTAGYKLINASNWNLYYILGFNRDANAQTNYNSFTQNMFSGGHTLYVDDPMQLGVEMAIWSDLPTGQDEIAVAQWANPSLRVVAQIAWESPKPGSYDDFLALGSTVGHAPGYVINERRVGQLLNITAARSTNGAIQLFTVRDGRVQMNTQGGPNATFRGWNDLGLPGAQGLAVGAHNSGQLEVFAVGDDNVLYHATQSQTDLTRYSAWAALPGEYVSNELAVGNSPYDGKLQVFAAGLDGSMHTIAQTSRNGGWGAWADFGGNNYHTPRTQLDGDGRLAVYTVGADGLLYLRYQTKLGGPWSDWASMQIPGEKMAREMTVGRNANGAVQIFAASTDGELWTVAQHGPNAAFGSWLKLGGNDVHVPAVGLGPQNRLEVFVTGGNGQLFRMTQKTASGWDQWGGWIPMAGYQLSRDNVVINNQNRMLEVFQIGGNGAPYTIWQTAADDSTWSGWLAMA